MIAGERKRERGGMGIGNAERADGATTREAAGRLEIREGGGGVKQGGWRLESLLERTTR